MFVQQLLVIIAGTFYEMMLRYLQWNEKSKGALIVKKVCGVLVIGGGLYLIMSSISWAIQ